VVLTQQGEPHGHRRSNRRQQRRLIERIKTELNLPPNGEELVSLSSAMH